MLSRNIHLFYFMSCLNTTKLSLIKKAVLPKPVSLIFARPVKLLLDMSIYMLLTCTQYGSLYYNFNLLTKIRKLEHWIKFWLLSKVRCNTVSTIQKQLSVETVIRGILQIPFFIALKIFELFLERKKFVVCYQMPPPQPPPPSWAFSNDFFF